MYKSNEKLNMSNILSVTKAFYNGLTYDKEFYPSDIPFEPGCRLSALEINIQNADGSIKYQTALELWYIKNGRLFNSLDMLPTGYTEKDVRYLPKNHHGLVSCDNYKTHWIPTICAYDRLGYLRVYDNSTNFWKILEVDTKSNQNNNSLNSAFAQFLSNLFFN